MREPSGWLEATTFETVVASTPLISIDLLVENERGEFLLGLRKNRPAQGYWFVPGGRVRKNESLDEAFRRLTRIEIGFELARSEASFKGVHEHFYKNSAFGGSPSTHYVVLAYHIKIAEAAIVICSEQHNGSKWMSQAVIKTKLVHPYTKIYFESRHES